MGISDHLTCLLRNLYTGQESAVRTGHGTTDWFQIGKGVRTVAEMESSEEIRKKRKSEKRETNEGDKGMGRGEGKEAKRIRKK